MTNEPAEVDHDTSELRAEASPGTSPQHLSAEGTSEPVTASASPESSHQSAPRRPPGEAWLARWPVALVLAVLGVVAGFAWASQQPATYTSESRIAVGAGDLSSGAIAGFPEAAESLAANYARYINNNSLSGSAGVALTASPIPDSSIIRVDGVSTDPHEANTQVQKASDDLVAQVEASQKQGDALAAYVRASQAWSHAETTQADAQADVTRLKARATIPQLRLNAALARLTRAISSTDVAALKKSTLGVAYSTQQNSSTAADLAVVVPASTIDSNRTSLRERYALLGGVAGLALSLVVAVGLERRTARRRRSV